MINNNKKTTILITSIMLTAVLLLPNSAFGEIPLNCEAGVANIGAVLAITPSEKSALNTPVGIAAKVTNSVDSGIACDAEAEDASLLVNGVEIRGTSDCPFDANLFTFPFADGEEVVFWPDEFGSCSNVDNLVNGFNQIQFDAEGIQFNIEGSSLPAPWTTSVSTAKPIYSSCISVEKDGPIKVKLDDGEATVTYEVWVTNCADGLLESSLDNCVIVDTIAGTVNQDLGVIAPDIEVHIEYDAVISGDTTNTVTVTCDDQNDNGISDSDTHFVETYTAGITVEKEAPDKLSDLETVFYDVWIFNDGSSTISDCVITDPSLGFEDDTSCLSIPAGGECHVDIEGGICIEAVDNQAFVTCKDQEDEDVSGQSEIVTAPFCASFSVDIDKECDTKVVQVPQNPSDPINCEIWVLNDGLGTLTNCVVEDSLSGVLDFPDTLEADQEVHIDTETDVTPEMIAAGTVTNTATITCDTQEIFDPVSDTVSVEIEVRSVDGDVDKNCETTVQLEPGTIEWDWTVSNDSPDGTSSLDVECSGVSTINDPEAQDALDIVLASGGTATNMWTESGLDDGSYTDTITCTFTAQNDLSFERTDSDTCEVDPTGGAGCTPGFWKNNADKKDYAAWPDSAIKNFSFSSVFGEVITIDGKKKSTITDPTLEQALSATGGGINALARHGVAAYLNSIDAEVDYPISTADVIAWVQDGIDTGDYEVHKSELAAANELGCTQNQQGEPSTD